MVQGFYEAVRAAGDEVISDQAGVTGDHPPRAAHLSRSLFDLDNKPDVVAAAMAHQQVQRRHPTEILEGCWPGM